MTTALPVMKELYAAERWVAITGFEGFYEVSSQGRVKSLDRVIDARNHPKQSQRVMRGRLIAQKTNKQSGRDYRRKQVCLSKNGKDYTFNVARLVAQAFIPNPFNYPFVLHLDDDATNNNVANLQWGTHNENCRQAASRDRLKYGQEHWQSSLSDVDRRSAYEMLLKGEKINTVAAKFSVKRQVISELKRGLIKGYAGIKNDRIGTRGQENKKSIISEAQARQIKIRLKNGEKCRSLAREYGVAPSTISAIKRGVNWGWLDIGSEPA